MLKIRKEKMQELEKFGFNKSGDCYYYGLYTGEGDKLEIEVMQNRIIDINFNTTDNGDDYSISLDILYDLFINNMVEKVDE